MNEVKWFSVKKLAYCVLLAGLSSYAEAKVSDTEAAKLGIQGTELTPLGAIRAGNKDGSLAAWEGGITKPPNGYVEGGFYPNPFPEDKILFTITSKNYEQYLEQLLPGNVEMFKRYPDTYRMNIYQSRRTAAYPEWLYNRTIANATRVERCPEVNDRCFKGFSDGGGIPFPIPKDGMEAMLNHGVFFQGKQNQGQAAGVIVNPDKSYVINTNSEFFLSPYWFSSDDPERPKNDWFYRRGGIATICFGQLSREPARFAGQFVAGCGYNTNAFLDAYIYVPGQRRVRKAPKVAFYDAPGGGGTSDGVRTSDAREGYLLTGNEEWYEYKMHPKKEAFISYNNFLVADEKLTWGDLIQSGHFNPDYIRYELHRVHVLEMTLKGGFRHLIPHRFTYIDEDSWYVAHALMYNQAGKAWRVSEQFMFPFYNVPMTHIWGDGQYDLISGRYVTVNKFWNLQKGLKPLDYKSKVPEEIYTPQGLRKYGVR